MGSCALNTPPDTSWLRYSSLSLSLSLSLCTSLRLSFSFSTFLSFFPLFTLLRNAVATASEKHSEHLLQQSKSIRKTREKKSVDRDWMFGLETVIGGECGLPT